MALTDWIKQMQKNQAGTTYGSEYPYLRKSPIELMIMQQAMAQNADSNTLAGFAFGKLLRGLFDDWKERYDARGTLNRMAEMDENKRNEILTFLEKNNPQQYQRTQEYLAKKSGTWDTWQNTPKSARQTTSETTAPIMPTVQTQPLTTDTPFKLTSAPWQDDNNGNKWNNLGDALASLKMRW